MIGEAVNSEYDIFFWFSTTTLNIFSNVKTNLKYYKHYICKYKVNKVWKITQMTSSICTTKSYTLCSKICQKVSKFWKKIVRGLLCKENFEKPWFEDFLKNVIFFITLICIFGTLCSAVYKQTLWTNHTIMLKTFII